MQQPPHLSPCCNPSYQHHGSLCTIHTASHFIPLRPPKPPLPRAAFSPFSTAMTSIVSLVLVLLSFASLASPTAAFHARYPSAVFHGWDADAVQPAADGRSVYINDGSLWIRELDLHGHIIRTADMGGAIPPAPASNNELVSLTASNRTLWVTCSAGVLYGIDLASFSLHYNISLSEDLQPAIDYDEVPRVTVDSDRQRVYLSYDNAVWVLSDNGTQMDYWAVPIPVTVPAWYVAVSADGGLTLVDGSPILTLLLPVMKVTNKGELLKKGTLRLPSKTGIIPFRALAVDTQDRIYLNVAERGVLVFGDSYDLPIATIALPKRVQLAGAHWLDAVDQARGLSFSLLLARQRYTAPYHQQPQLAAIPGQHSCGQ